MIDLHAAIDRELALAETSRAQGLEGRARVCARRAAALAVRAYLEGRGEEITTLNAVELLQGLLMRPELPVTVHQAVEHLLMRVTPEYRLPIDIDLIQEARTLADTLFSQP